MFVEGQAAIQELLCPSTYTAAGVNNTSWPSPSLSNNTFGSTIDVSRFSALRIYVRCAATNPYPGTLSLYLWFDEQMFMYNYGSWLNDVTVLTIPVQGRMFRMMVIHDTAVGSANFRVEGIYQPLSVRSGYVPYLGAGHQHNDGRLYGTVSPASGVTRLDSQTLASGVTPPDMIMGSPNASRIQFEITTQGTTTTTWNLSIASSDAVLDNLAIPVTTTKTKTVTQDYPSTPVYNIIANAITGTLTYTIVLRALA